MCVIFVCFSVFLRPASLFLRMKQIDELHHCSKLLEKMLPPLFLSMRWIPCVALDPLMITKPQSAWKLNFLFKWMVLSLLVFKYTFGWFLIFSREDIRFDPIFIPWFMPSFLYTFCLDLNRLDKTLSFAILVAPLHSRCGLLPSWCSRSGSN